MAWFRLLVGKHIENDKNGKEKVYSSGDVFESDLNLLALNGGGGMSPKFEMLQTSPYPYAPTSVPPTDQGQPPQMPPMVPVVPISEITPPIQPKTPPPPKMPPVVTPVKAEKRNLDEEYGPLDRMSVKDLQQIGKDESIDLTGITNKIEMIKVLRAGS